MPLPRDPAKQVKGVAIGLHQGEQRVVLLLDGDDLLVVETRGLTRTQAEMLGEGYVDGLRAAGSGLGDSFDDEELEVEVVPGNLTPGERMLVERGSWGGLDLAAQGYWIEDKADELAAPGSIH